MPLHYRFLKAIKAAFPVKTKTYEQEG